MHSYINRLFKRQTTGKSSGEISVNISSEVQQETLTPPNKLSSRFIYGSAVSVGKLREHNEDSLFSMSLTIIENDNLHPIGLFIVADGMGGHQYGEIASNIAIRTVANSLLTRIYLPLVEGGDYPEQSILEELLRNSIRDANKNIIHHAPGGGTTLTAALILANSLYIVHVGDSRLYWCNSKGCLQLFTRDHTLVNRLVELGQITNDQAIDHPQRNVIYRALGQGEPLDPDIHCLPLPEDGYLLVCSDGLWGAISNEMITNILINSSSPQNSCENLINAANDAGGSDNISAIVVAL